MNPAPPPAPLNGATPPQFVVNHAFNLKQRVDPPEIEVFRDGPTELFISRIKSASEGFGALDDNPKYEAFLRAARKHGVRVIITLAVEEPAAIQ